MEENDRVLDAEQWKIEANAIINDVKHHLQDIQISDCLQSKNTSIFLNITTLEGRKYCVKVSGVGFEIVGDDYNVVEKRSEHAFETAYSLLDSISPQYRDSFSKNLMDKLSKLADQNN